MFDVLRKSVTLWFRLKYSDSARYTCSPVGAENKTVTLQVNNRLRWAEDYCVIQISLYVYGKALIFIFFSRFFSIPLDTFFTCFSLQNVAFSCWRWDEVKHVKLLVVYFSSNTISCSVIKIAMYLIHCYYEKWINSRECVKSSHFAFNFPNRRSNFVNSLFKGSSAWKFWFHVLHKWCRQIILIDFLS